MHCDHHGAIVALERPVDVRSIAAAYMPGTTEQHVDALVQQQGQSGAAFTGAKLTKLCISVGVEVAPSTVRIIMHFGKVDMKRRCE